MTDTTTQTDRHRAGSTRFEQLDVGDDDAMATAYEIMRAAYTQHHPEDPLPAAAEVIAAARAPRRGQRSEFWMLLEGTDPVGMCWLDLPLLDNPELVEVSLAVDPEHQHRGHGRALLGHLVDRVAELGRHQVIGAVNEPPDGSVNRPMRFAAAAGATRALGEMRRTLDLATLDLPRLASLTAQAEAASAGYTLVSWTGRCPEALVEDYAALLARMSTDAPMGGLGIEPEHYDAERVREVEAVVLAQGRTRYVTAARFGAQRPLVAFNELVSSVHDPPNALNWDTLVLREHRGRRLGLRTKIANLGRLRAGAPDALRVHTWNADENRHMIAINEAMGFAVAQRESEWRLDLPR